MNTPEHAYINNPCPHEEAEKWSAVVVKKAEEILADLNEDSLGDVMHADRSLGTFYALCIRMCQSEGKERHLVADEIADLVAAACLKHAKKVTP